MKKNRKDQIDELKKGDILLLTKGRVIRFDCFRTENKSLIFGENLWGEISVQKYDITSSHYDTFMIADFRAKLDTPEAVWLSCSKEYRSQLTGFFKKLRDIVARIKDL